ncbi:MAG: tRNA pseudouridine(38-40) synthase TruA [Bacillota bacterium]
MRNIKLTIEYDGTRYSGWQIQKNTLLTIQQKLQDALTVINKRPVKVQGASRTDAGVHAEGQVANIYLDVPIPIDRIPMALNRKLPGDIICKFAENVDDDFHARYDTVAKKYRYRIYNSKLPSVFVRNYVYHYIYNIDIKAVKEASRYFLGRHDFSSFQSSGSYAENTVKTINSLEVIKKGKELWIEIEGSGFLYNMVRIIVGTILEVSMGKIKISDIEDIIKSCDREQAGYTVPASGLTLLEVYY